MHVALTNTCGTSLGSSCRQAAGASIKTCAKGREATERHRQAWRPAQPSRRRDVADAEVEADERERQRLRVRRVARRRCCRGGRIEREFCGDCAGGGADGGDREREQLVVAVARQDLEVAVARQDLRKAVGVGPSSS